MRNLFLCFFAFCFLLMSCKSDSKPNTISPKSVKSAQHIFGLNFTNQEIDTVISTLERCLSGYQAMRKNPIDHTVAPAFHFDLRPSGFRAPTGESYFQHDDLPIVQMPSDEHEIAFYSIPQLASLLRSNQITSRKLTQLYIDRLNRLDEITESVITLTSERAFQQADLADADFAAGIDHSILQGIPYGVKDLAAIPEYPTTWGAAPYKDQIINDTAEIIRKLDQAGAVLIAKLSSGELANGDVWFNGKTKNPWDLEQGASGSSAGPGAATAAGLVGFSIGTETWGSILSPSTRCGITGLRPTYGRVSRYGVMPLAWTLDKIGPMCRTAEGCAYVFEAIIGQDEKDRSSSNLPVYFDRELDLSSINASYLKEVFEKDTTERGINGLTTIDKLMEMGLALEETELPNDLPWSDLMYYVIRGEASAIFDQLMVENEDDLLTRDTRFSRANSLRAGEFIPAVAYIQANRHRTTLIEQMDSLFQVYDILCVLSSGSDQSAISNLTGHPAISIPNGFDEKGRPTSMILIGKLYDEGTLLSIGAQYQELTDFESRVPEGFE
jgi:Asp-tRNA(Asn)/Glu-tRNA(Gln) amidotransferase A subunit family amidase